MMHKPLTLNPALTIEDFGTEIIIVNLRNGSYFTLNDDAAVTWRTLHDSVSVEDFLQKLKQAFTLDNLALSRLSQLLLNFQQDELGEISPDVFSHLTAMTPEQTNGNTAFSRFAYQKFTDIQDILLLDPIHDVGELGWPHRKS